MSNDDLQKGKQALLKRSVEDENTDQSKKAKQGVMRSKSLNEIVNLDVGGVRFKTTRQTLSLEPSSMLSRMFSVDSEMSPGIMTEGAYFLDRQPEVFEEILRYLRSGRFVPPQDKRLIEEMKIECEYFGLDGLKSLIIRSNPRPDDELIINCRGTRFRTTRETLTKYKFVTNRDPNNSWDIGEKFIEMFDGRSDRRILPERDGTYFLDLDPRFLSEYVIPLIQIDPENDEIHSADQMYEEEKVIKNFEEKYGMDFKFEWGNEFAMNYGGTTKSETYLFKQIY